MTEPTVPKERAIVEVSDSTNKMVETEMANETDAAKQETKELIEAIKKLAQSEVQAAGDFTREAYVNAVREARETIERIKLIDTDSIERAGTMLERETEQNWQAMVKEIQDFGDRLVAAAQAAWDVLTAENPPSGKN
ncbi:MAG: hypothetical protein SXA11_01290 [Cyanobacteriota bacterium]|nr:hypothetical protein [Cyanobacteriota bacterium]